LFLHPIAQVARHLRDLVGLALDRRTDTLPDRQHARPHFGSNSVVLEIFTIIAHRAGVDLGTGADYSDPKDRSALQLCFCGWDTGVVPAVGDEIIRDAVHGPVLLVLVRNEVRVAVENGTAVVAAVIERRQCEFDAVQQGGSYADG